MHAASAAAGDARIQSAPTSERVPTSSPEKAKVEKAARAVKTAPKTAVKTAIERIAREHEDLIKDLAK